MRRSIMLASIIRLLSRTKESERLEPGLEPDGQEPRIVTAADLLEV